MGRDARGRPEAEALPALPLDVSMTEAHPSWGPSSGRSMAGMVHVSVRRRALASLDRGRSSEPGGGMHSVGPGIGLASEERATSKSDDVEERRDMGGRGWAGKDALEGRPTTIGQRSSSIARPEIAEPEILPSTHPTVSLLGGCDGAISGTSPRPTARITIAARCGTVVEDESRHQQSRQQSDSWRRWNDMDHLNVRHAIMLHASRGNWIPDDQDRPSSSIPSAHPGAPPAPSSNLWQQNSSELAAWYSHGPQIEGQASHESGLVVSQPGSGHGTKQPRDRVQRRPRAG
nr:hypothetical protein CFP56_66147 [Quercus suber]